MYFWEMVNKYSVRIMELISFYCLVMQAIRHLKH